MEPRAFFEELVAGASERAKELAGVKAVLKFDIADLGVWRLQIDGTDLEIQEGDGPAGCTFPLGPMISSGSLRAHSSRWWRSWKASSRLPATSRWR